MLVMEVMMKADLGIELETHMDRMNSRTLSPKLPNTHGLNVVNIILPDRIFHNCYSLLITYY